LPGLPRLAFRLAKLAQEMDVVAPDFDINAANGCH
jgi:hypothetical protein